MNVAILGCGPAGLLAAHAAEQSGADDIIIYSLRNKSVIMGAQYLHDPIPGLTGEPDGEVHYLKHGTRDGYAKKVYGSSDKPCSWDSFESGAVPAWRLDALYDRLWESWFETIMNDTIDGRDIEDLLVENDLVISAIPKPNLCMNSDHEFRQKDVWIAPYNNLPYDVSQNVIVYNGDPLDHWYRASTLWGHEATESTDPMEGAVLGVKPLGNNCTCHDGKIACVGRFGRWEKGVLVHHAYLNALEACCAVQRV